MGSSVATNDSLPFYVPVFYRTKFLVFVSRAILSVNSFNFPEQHSINQYMFLLGTMRQELRHILFGRSSCFRCWK